MESSPQAHLDADLFAFMLPNYPRHVQGLPNPAVQGLQCT